MIATIWKFVNEQVLQNVFSASLVLLGTLLIVIAVSFGPKFLQKEKKSKRGAIEEKVETAFKKVDDEIGSSIVNDSKEDKDEGKESQPTTTQDISISQPTTTQDISISQPTTTQDISISQPTTTQDISISQPTTTQDIS
ncbi:hypothetical protein NGRA_3532, partial [Nosema granulosis]